MPHPSSSRPKRGIPFCLPADPFLCGRGAMTGMIPRIRSAHELGSGFAPGYASCAQNFAASFCLAICPRNRRLQKHQWLHRPSGIKQCRYISGILGELAWQQLHDVAECGVRFHVSVALKTAQSNSGQKSRKPQTSWHASMGWGWARRSGLDVPITYIKAPKTARIVLTYPKDACV